MSDRIYGTKNWRELRQRDAREHAWRTVIYIIGAVGAFVYIGLMLWLHYVPKE